MSNPNLEALLGAPAAPATPPLHGLEAPSPWVQRWAHLLAPQSRVLDVASGAGRHSRFFASLGHSVTAIDRDTAALALLADAAQVHCILADIENGTWPLTGQRFGAVVVTNYLWRPLLPTLLASLAPGGVLIYETFARGNETVGKPSRPDFLLQTGELLQTCAHLRVVAYEDGFLEAPARFVQRIVAVQETVRKAATGAFMPPAQQSGAQAASAGPARYRL
jgi:SAM-dependent methyltransferase